MITGKQRNYLKKVAHDIKPIAQIGKAGVTENFLIQIANALEAREIVKVKVLDNSFLDTKETANEVANAVGAEFVQAIGNKFTIYKASTENPKIELPKN
ncbi:MAG: ribosome assembly RNA-binding protein YhbY [Clostridiales bacterium]|mgnify:CR=1 FL=1|nr:ribosome assembly RNA-binding protein YhbY [Clostridiales bacterium]